MDATCPPLYAFGSANDPITPFQLTDLQDQFDLIGLPAPDHQTQLLDGSRHAFDYWGQTFTARRVTQTVGQAASDWLAPRLGLSRHCKLYNNYEVQRTLESKTMETVPPRLVEYFNTTREPLPPISSPDELLHIDSLGLIRLVAFIENDLGIRIEDEEMLADNFVTLRALGNSLRPRRASRKKTKSRFQPKLRKPSRHA